VSPDLAFHRKFLQPGQGLDLDLPGLLEYGHDLAAIGKTPPTFFAGMRLANSLPNENDTLDNPRLEALYSVIRQLRPADRAIILLFLESAATARSRKLPVSAKPIPAFACNASIASSPNASPAPRHD
jgi:hypothetical protein